MLQSLDPWSTGHAGNLANLMNARNHGNPANPVTPVNTAIPKNLETRGNLGILKIPVILGSC